MRSMKKYVSHARSSLSFMKQFVRSPRDVGAVWPSSQWLCDGMMAGIDLQRARYVAELGAGTGVLTRTLLQALPDNARLDAYEIHPGFISVLETIPDPRLEVRMQPAQQLNKSYEVIFSGLPLLAFTPAQRQAVLARVKASLHPGGYFIQFQYTSQIERELSHHFDWQRRRVWLNMPPAWVYQCSFGSPEGK